MTDFTYHCACCGGRHWMVEPSPRFPFVCDGCVDKHIQLELPMMEFAKLVKQIREREF